MNTLKQNFFLNELVSLSASRILLLVMMFTTALSFQSLFRFMAPVNQYGSLPWICLLVSLEALVMFDQLRRPIDLDHSRTYYRVMEWVVILVVIKVVLSIEAGLAQLWREVPQYPVNFIESFFSTEYLLVVLAAFFCWGMQTWYLSDLREIEGDVVLVDASAMDGFYSNRSLIRRRLTGRFLSIGFGMVLAHALISIDYQALFAGRLEINRQGVLNLVIYFMAGFLLLSQTHFAVLRASWAWERIPIEPGLAKRWLIYSLVALGLVSLLAFVLPTQYSLGLLSTLAFVFSILAAVAYGLFFIIAAPLMALLGLLSRLLRLGEGPLGALPPPTLPEPPPALPESPLPPWVKILQSILFWVVFLSVIGFAFYQYVRQNKALADRLRKFRLMRFFVQAWDWLRGRVFNLNQAVGATISAGVQKLRQLFRRSPTLDPFNYINPRKLPPRLQVIFYYLALVRRGGEAGITRQPAQTPYEYARSVSRSLPEAGEDVQIMTEAFMEARYSQHQVSAEQSTLVSRIWQRIRKALTVKDRPWWSGGN